MLRRANEHEAAAFHLVERTMRRARPTMGVRGLRSIQVPEGTIERSSLGRLRFRFDGASTDLEPENGVRTRPVSEEESSWWTGLERIVDAANPVADAEWNLVSMKIGPRVLRRLPLGRIVTFVPNGTPPFKGSFSVTLPNGHLDPDALRLTEAQLLLAIDDFLRETEERAEDQDPRLMAPWSPGSGENRAGNHGVSSPLTRAHRHARGKWQRCPICHTPVVKDRFNPWIPLGALRPGAGSIRDLKGGYLSRLRETYLLPEANSLVQSRESR